MDFAIALLRNSAQQTLVSLSHNWPYLLASILIAAALKVFVDADRISAFLARHRGAGVLTATAAAVATPFCSCGTTAVVLGMMASTMPLAPIVAFMVASPLSSPEELLYSAGLFGWPFAISYFAASILLGLAGGGIATLLERRGLLAGQVRFEAPAKAEAAPSCGCQAPAPAPAFVRRGAPSFARVETPSFVRLETPALCCEAAAPSPLLAAPLPSGCGCGPSFRESEPEQETSGPSPSSRIGNLLVELGLVAKKLLPMFIGFAFVGYVLNGLIPASWMSALFGKGHAYSVPLAATVGLPLYVSSEASLPLVRALLDSGMSQGAIMAFLIAGSGTSMGAIAGALTIARWKVVGLVVAVLWLGAILAGYGFDILVASGLA
ncbi:MAG TPA: permease [Rectinemataceae bacterium]|nr:permease [Rectinemataceae bacterium]